MKIKHDEKFYTFDGNGLRALCTLTSDSKLKVLEINQEKRKYHCSMIIPLLKKARFEYALQKCVELGIKNVKIGHVGAKLDKKYYHYSQYGVNYFRRVLDKALEYKIGVNFHEPIKDTGERRTYPNMLTREGARGMEYNAWPGGNPPNHTLILPFTRLLGSPMDFTPGIFDLSLIHI